MKNLETTELSMGIIHSAIIKSHDMTKEDVDDINYKIKNFESSKEFEICKEIVSRKLDPDVDIMQLIISSLKGDKKEIFKSILLIVRCQHYWNADKNGDRLYDIYKDYV